ncbi:MAG TPA: hypothetical protein PK435_14995 [Thermoanaerobaculaceae bacterium]|nr:hypothetical protein [Thermoanaerobaculaceae bacterium]
MAKRFAYFVGLLVVASWGATARAQSTQFSLDLGQQWTDVSGNNDVYRSQINEGQGLLLRSFSLTTVDNSDGPKLFDHLRIDAAGIGADPQASFRLSAGLAHVYSLRFSYRHSEFYNALPAYANPLFASGLTPGEHTINRALDTINLDVEVLPGEAITPLFGYQLVRYTGLGRSTAQVGQNEFRLLSDLNETTQEISGGVGFKAGGFEGRILQGWRVFDSTQNDRLLPGGGAGNNPQPLLGQPVTLTNYTDYTETRGTTPVTTGYLTGRLADGVRLVASFARADFETDTGDDEAASGTLASFKLARFYSGLSESVHAHAQSLDWQGNARIEAEIIDGLDLTVGYTKRHRELDGLATIADLYANTVNFSGADPKSVSTLINAQTAMERNENIVEARLSSSNLGPLGLWVGWSRANQSLTVAPAAAEIIVPGGQGGRFDRQVKRTSAGATLALADVKLAVDWKKDDADNAVVRTDYLNLERWRGRASWRAGSFLELVGTAERIKAENPTAGIDQASTTKHWEGNVVLTPVTALSVSLGYGVYKVDSAITIRVPQDFSLEPSLYTEDGTSKDASLTYKVGRFGFDAGYSQFENNGDLALKLDRTTLGCDFDITPTVGASLRFDKHMYREVALPIDNFDAKIYGVFLRWHN